MERDKETLIFDLDGTLINTSKLYRWANETFIGKMQELFPYEGSATINDVILQEEKRWSPIYGFRKERYPLVLASAYLSLACEHHDRVNLRVYYAMYDLGSKVFEKTAELREGALDLLEWAQTRYHLYLYTLGDPYVQRKRIADAGIGHYFEVCHITPEKDRAALEDFLDCYGIDPAMAWMIGDSPAHDIVPAHEAGLRAILVNGDPWPWDLAELDDHNAWKVDHLREVSGVLEGERASAEAACP